jgi:hypothetical protein
MKTTLHIFTSQVDIYDEREGVNRSFTGSVSWSLKLTTGEDGFRMGFDIEDSEIQALEVLYNEKEDLEYTKSVTLTIPDSKIIIDQNDTYNFFMQENIGFSKLIIRRDGLRIIP